MMQVVRIWG